MLEFNEISINDKALFDKYLSATNPDISEMTFTNIFMWRKSYKFRFAEHEGLLLIITVPEKSEPFAFMPLGKYSHDEFRKTFYILKDYFSTHGWNLRFKRISQESLLYFSELENEEITYEFDRDSSDYVYLTNDLINLKGKKFDGKRNHINKFKKLYSYEYEKIDESNISECHRIMEEWCNEHNCSDHDEFYCEKIANRELLNNYEALACKGAVIKADGKVEAFTVGEMLNPDTAVIHIEKANGKINGIYTFINQQFCLNEWQNTSYVNREQDLGVEGLRKAKLSYNPVKIINKHNIIIHS